MKHDYNIVLKQTIGFININMDILWMMTFQQDKNILVIEKTKQQKLDKVKWLFVNTGWLKQLCWDNKLSLM